jgi:GT2 family glycosyltransferase
MFYFKHDAIRDIEVLAGCFLVVRREALEQVGYLDDQFFIYAEDIDWCKRFWESGWRVVFFPGAEAIHYGGASSSNAPLRFSAAQEQSRVQYWSKHHRKLSVLAFYCIIISQHALRIFFEGLTYVVRPATRTSNKIILTKHFSCLRVLLKS